MKIKNNKNLYYSRDRRAVVGSRTPTTAGVNLRGGGECFSRGRFYNVGEPRKKYDIPLRYYNNYVRRRDRRANVAFAARERNNVVVTYNVYSVV